MANTTTFKAVRVAKFGDPSVLELKNVEEGELEQDEVLVKLHAVGVNPVDTYIRSGAYSRLPAELPYTPGGDGAGIIEKVGSKVTEVKEGDRVWLSGSVSGTYAQKTKAKQSACHLLPEIVSFAQGASINVPYATAYRALFVRGVGKRKTEGKMKVLVHGGSGGVGIAAIQFAVDAGMEVFATAGSAEGIELMKKQGAHYTYNHRETNYHKQIQSDAKDGVDMVIEMLANVNLETDITLLRRSGAVMIVGNRGTVEINPRGLMGREADIRGVALSLSNTEERKEIDDAIQDGLKRGALKPVVGEERKLEDVAKAHVDILTTRRLGKMILVPWAE